MKRSSRRAAFPPSVAEIPVDLQGHVPTREARARAESAGMDLDRLKRERPDEYRILNAEAVVRVSPELAQAVADLIPERSDRKIYSVPGEPAVRLLAFPPLSADELEAFDELAARWVAQEDVAGTHAFYRSVRDPHGEHRELMIPIHPQAWNGEVALVGPFEQQEQAEAWPAGRLPANLIGDPLPYRGKWYCDVFDSEEAWLDQLARPTTGGEPSDG